MGAIAKIQTTSPKNAIARPPIETPIFWDIVWMILRIPRNLPLLSSGSRSWDKAFNGVKSAKMLIKTHKKPII